jgi:hypothetical protein
LQRRKWSQKGDRSLIIIPCKTLLIELPSKCSTLASKVEYHPNIKLKHLFFEKHGFRNTQNNSHKGRKSYCIPKPIEHQYLKSIQHKIANHKRSKT